MSCMEELTANLRHPDYGRVLYGFLNQLPLVFAQLDKPALALARISHHLPTADAVMSVPAGPYSKNRS